MHNFGKPAADCLQLPAIEIENIAQLDKKLFCINYSVLSCRTRVCLSNGYPEVSPTYTYDTMRSCH